MAERTQLAERTQPARGSGHRPLIPGLPVQVVAMIGLSGTCYAVSVAAVTGLQSASDRALTAARAPYAAGVGALGQGNDRLERRLSALRDQDRLAVDADNSVRAAVAELEARLDRLSATVTSVDGAAKGLPARAPMPLTVRSVGVARASTPAHATTGGSGAP